jgi:nucleoside phosphorylase
VEEGAVAHGRRQFDIGIVVPLREEFRYILEVAPQLEAIPHAGTYFYRLDFGATSAVCCVVDQMGTLPALQAATRLLEFVDVKMLAVLGVAGGLDDDVALGDVVVAAEINEFQANSKAESTESGYEFRYSGRHWSLEYQIREALTNFEFSGKELFDGWKAATTGHYSDLGLTDKVDVNYPASVHFGPIASGNVVAASSAFVSEVKRIDRKFVAIDMEAAGVAFAAGERIHPLPCLIIRGISDRADEKKKALDGQGKKAWRRYAVRNATAFLLMLLRWEGFLMATGLQPRTSTSGSDGLAGKLASELKACIGGPWLAGVIFGIYQHGPAVLDAGIVPADLSRLRVLDARIRKLLDSAEEAKEALLADGDVSKAAKCVAHLVEGYRGEAGTSNVDAILGGFDQVVLAILCPDEENQQVESLLLQAEKLEEDTGAGEVAEFLKEFIGLHPLIRERYIDALATSHRWSEIVVLIKDIDKAQLSRLELEHGFSACAETGLSDRASALIRQHQSAYGDNSAKVFRRQVGRRYANIEYDHSGDEK